MKLPLRRVRLLASALVFTACACGGASMPPSLSHPLAGEAAPSFEHANANGDGLVRVPARGPGRVTVVDFWATWCAGCRHTMPALDALWREHKERGVNVVGVCIDDDLGEVRSFAAQLGTRFPLIVDEGQRIAAAWGVRRIPLTFVLDEDGVVRWVGRDPANVRRAVEALMSRDARPHDAFAD